MAFRRDHYGGLTLCVSNEIIHEYHEILQLKNGEEVAKNMIDFFTVHPFIEKHEPYFNFLLIAEDEDDNRFVDCAIASNAFALVSNDKHFQVLNKISFPKVKVLTLSELQDWFYRKS
jgi:predicted nucleic acid-binding protein